MRLIHIEYSDQLFIKKEKRKNEMSGKKIPHVLYSFPIKIAVFWTKAKNV